MSFDDDSDVEIAPYFRSNLLLCRNGIDPDEFRTFSCLDTNAERVAFVLSRPEIEDLSLEVENHLVKDLSKAINLKEIGNKYFGQESFSYALENYSKAIIVAPKKELGIFLANRSAALYNLDNHELALRDIESALHYGYPQELKYKLLERQARCYLALKKSSPAIESFKKALTALDDAKITMEKKQKLEMDMRIMLKVIEKGNELSEKDKSKGKIADKATSKYEQENIPKITDCNLLYPACSSAVEIVEGNETIGRHGIATRDIIPGELLFVEKPHTSVLLSDYRLTNCHLCMKKNIAPYPAECDKCLIIAYCSPKCRDEDAKLHEVECSILGPLWLSSVSVTCLMAIRAIMQTPWSKLRPLKDDFKKYNGKFKPTLEQPFKSKNYLALWSMVSHQDERTAEDMFHRAYMAAWMMRLIKTSPYLPEESKSSGDQPLTEDELFMAELLLHHLQLLQFNSHEISELSKRKGDITLSRSKSNFIGGGIFPTPALLNHSCNPGVVRYFLGTTMIMRAVRTIRAGEEVCDNYGPAFMNDIKPDRQRRLRTNYWFDCNCEACMYNWPTLDQIDPKILRFKCETGPSCGNVLLVNVDADEFMLRCSKCNKCTNIMMGLKALQDTDHLFKVATQYMEKGDHTNALKSYTDILKLLDTTLALPIKDYYIGQQGLKLIYLSKGNTFVINE